jgi:hypothetical protein
MIVAGRALDLIFDSVQVLVVILPIRIYYSLVGCLSLPVHLGEHAKIKAGLAGSAWTTFLTLMNFAMDGSTKRVTALERYVMVRKQQTWA